MMEDIGMQQEEKHTCPNCGACEQYTDIVLDDTEIDRVCDQCNTIIDSFIDGYWQG